MIIPMLGEIWMQPENRPSLSGREARQKKFFYKGYNTRLWFRLQPELLCMLVRTRMIYYPYIAFSCMSDTGIDQLPYLFSFCALETVHVGNRVAPTLFPRRPCRIPSSSSSQGTCLVRAHIRKKGNSKEKPLFSLHSSLILLILRSDSDRKRKIWQRSCK